MREETKVQAEDCSVVNANANCVYSTHLITLEPLKTAERGALYPAGERNGGGIHQLSQVRRQPLDKLGPRWGRRIVNYSGQITSSGGKDFYCKDFRVWKASNPADPFNKRSLGDRNGGGPIT